MREFRSRRHWRKIFLSWPVVVIALVIVLWIFGSAFMEYLKARNAEIARIEVDEELDFIKERLNTLNERINAINSEIGLEKILRERFNIKKPGEHVLIIMDNENQDGLRDDEQQNESFFRNLWATVKNIL